VKRSTSVTLTVIAAMGLGARAQQAAEDPCGPASFNPKVCQTAVRRGGYCSQGVWVPADYQEPYPYYYGLNLFYQAQGGVATAVPEEKCKHGHGFFHPIHGGFGSTGAGHSAKS
jgi:hypothetical protein